MPDGANIELVQRHLEITIAKSELKRIKLYLGTLLLGLLVMCFNFFLINGTTDVFHNEDTKYYVIGWFVIYIGYELVALYLGTLFLKKKVIVPFVMKIGNVAFEAAMPSFLLMILCIREFSAIFLDSPLIFFYAIIIVTSSLHLDVRLALITGLVTAVGYLTVTLVALNAFDPNHSEMHFPPVLYMARSIFLFASSLTAVFMAKEFKKREVDLYNLLTDKIQIKRLLGQQLSVEVADTIISDNFSSKKQVVTVMFLDVRNFSTFAEKHSPADVNTFQNSLFGPLITIIRNNGGIANQIMGDGIMATFGVRETDTDHSANAFNAAISILNKVAELGDKKVIIHTKIGVGLHRGEVIMSNIGNEFRKQFSVSGNTVNIAARLEQLNKEYNSELILSHAVLEHLDVANVEFEELGEIQVRNIKEKITLYQLHGWHVD